MSKTFRPFGINQPSSAAGPARLAARGAPGPLRSGDGAGDLDLSSIWPTIGKRRRSRPPYHPQMMVGLLLYAYCMGIPSCRKIEAATYTDVAFRVLAGNQHPDHDSIATFQAAPVGAFFCLCPGTATVRAGRIGLLGHVGWDEGAGQRSKQKAMSYGRMCEAQQRLEAEVAALLEQAQQTDAAEDEQFGKAAGASNCQRSWHDARVACRRSGRRRRLWSRSRSQSRAGSRGSAQEDRREKAPGRGDSRKAKGPTPKVPDPETAVSRGEGPEELPTRSPGSRGTERARLRAAYNAQAAVDGQAQIITAAQVTQEANDKQQLAAILVSVKENVGALS